MLETHILHHVERDGKMILHETGKNFEVVIIITYLRQWFNSPQSEQSHKPDQDSNSVHSEYKSRLLGLHLSSRFGKSCQMLSSELVKFGFCLIMNKCSYECEIWMDFTLKRINMTINIIFWTMWHDFHFPSTPRSSNWFLNAEFSTVVLLFSHYLVLDICNNVFSTAFITQHRKIGLFWAVMWQRHGIKRSWSI